jgi:hypothetical protein
VTESGINNEPEAHVGASPAVSDEASRTRVDLLWIAAPVGTYAGLLTLVGSEKAPDAAAPDAKAWQLPLSRYLGVRIYESQS